MSASPPISRRAVLAALGGAVAAAGLGTLGFAAATPRVRAPLAPADTAYGLTRAGGAAMRLAPDGTVLARAVLPEAPTGLTLVPDASRAIASVTGSNRVWTLSATDLRDVRERAIGHAPEIVAARPEHPHVAVAGIGDGAITLLDARSLDVLARIDGLAAPHDLRFDADGARLHVSLLDAPEVLTLEADTLRPVSTLRLPFPAGVDHMSATVDGRWGIAASPGEASVALVSLGRELRAERRVALRSPVSRAYSGPRGDLVWLPATGEPTITRLDLTTGEARTLSVPSIVRGLAFEPFATTLLAYTDAGLARIDRGGGIMETATADAGAAAAIESAVGTVLLGADGALWWQHAHRPLGPIPLPAPSAFRITSATALSYCH